MIKAIIVFIILMLIAACSNEPVRESLPVYNKYNNVTLEDEQANKVEVSVKPSEEVGEAILEDELSNFQGINSEVQTPAYGNLSINMKAFNNSCLVCPDPDRNVVYYANYGVDNYIYEYKDGISTLLLEQETDFIQVWKGELYFLGFNNEVDDGLHNNIYKYNLSTKQVKTLVEADIEWMYINENGIYFTKVDDGRFEGYKLPFDSNEIEKTQGAFSLPYRDYLVVLELDYNDNPTIKLMHNTSGDCILEINNVHMYRRGNMSVYQDYLCYIGYPDDGSEERVLNVLNLSTGDQITIRPVTISGNILESYTIINNKVICSTNSSLLVEYHLIDGTLFIKRTINNNIGYFEELYTNGFKLLAKRKSRDLKIKQSFYDFVELVIEDGKDEIIIKKPWQ